MICAFVHTALQHTAYSIYVPLSSFLRMILRRCGVVFHSFGGDDSAAVLLLLRQHDYCMAERARARLCTVYSSHCTVNSVRTDKSAHETLKHTHAFQIVIKPIMKR